MHSISYIFGFIGMVTGIASTAALIPTQPFLAGLSLMLIIISLLYILFIRYFYSYALIRRGIRKILQIIKKDNFMPDLLISFSRSGAVASGMLSVNLGVQELLVFSRRLIESGDNKNIATEKFSFSPYSQVNKEEVNKKKTLIVFMVLDTAETLRVGLEYLKEHGINTEDVKIATFFISPGVRQRWPDIIYAYEIANIKAFLDNLPWLSDKYHHV